MLRCARCECICDNSDLINGICDDCREEMQEEKVKQSKMAKMMESDGVQMRIDEFICGGRT